MKSRISFLWIVALVVLSAISGLVLGTSPSEATQNSTGLDDVVCQMKKGTVYLNHFVVIGEAAWADDQGNLKCSDLDYRLSDFGTFEFGGIGRCGGVGKEFCNSGDVIVIELTDLENATASSSCIQSDGGSTYLVTDECVFDMT